MNSRILALWGLYLFLMIACGKEFKVNSNPVASSALHEGDPTQTKKSGAPDAVAEDVGQFYRVKSRTKNNNNHARNITLNKKEYKVERERLSISKVTYDFKDDQMTLRGQLLFNTQTENFAMSGKIKNGLIDLIVTDSKSAFAEKLKARATCYSLSSNENKTQCGNFFIDFYYLDQGTFYTEQLIPKQEASSEKKNDQDKQDKDEKEISPEAKESAASAEAVTEGQAGYFVGDASKDIVELFPLISQETQEQAQPPQKLPTPPTSPKPPAKQPLPAPRAPVKPQPPSSPPKPAATKPKQGRPVNQAIGGLGGNQGPGRLQNASSLLEVFNRLGRTSGFQLLNTEGEKYFGTWDMIQLIQKMGLWVRDHVPGQVLSIGNITSRHGGPQMGQVSHQNGLDADIAYFTPSQTMEAVVDINSNKLNPNILLDDQWKLFKQLISTEMVNIIIVDPIVKKSICQRAVKLGEINSPNDNNLGARTLKRLYVDEGHYRQHSNHFHVRIWCSSFDRACKPQDPEINDQALGCDLSP
ncbi:MAG: penicillin-insensitive murein endopeptidase [Bdellovibrionota bacterium]